MRVILFKQFNVNLDNCKTCASVENLLMSI